jgi:hypothetical protein
MSWKHACGGLFAALMLAGLTGMAAAGPTGTDNATSDHIPRQADPAIDSVPPTPNGGMSSGAHLGNESPTYPGNSATGKSKLNSPPQTEGSAPSDDKTKADERKNAPKQ